MNDVDLNDITLERNVERFRNGIFLAPSRTYGEKFIEPIIREHFRWGESNTNDYDAITKDNERVEIKATKVLEKYDRGEGPFVERIISEGEKSEIHRLVPFSECTNRDYDSNIQNVKRDHFEILLYVMLFADCIKIFKLDSTSIGTDILPNWSDKHGRYDEVGKSGQFPINKKNIQWHIEESLVGGLTWDEVFEIAKGI
tara:strand:- start:44 stop:640 length:597 start_codon:yes stop_codon:yes gene_type:complete